MTSISTTDATGIAHSDIMPDGSYSSVHHNITLKRGRAATYPCARCQERADHWALNHAISDTQHIRHDVRGVYSLDLMAYLPLCASCHSVFDAQSPARADATEADLDIIRSRTW